MTEQTDAPLPCPFCGGDNIGHYEVEGRDNHSFECHDCLAGSACKSTYNEALAAWSRRNPQPAQAQAGAVDDTALIRQMVEALVLNNAEWKSLADSGDSGFWKAEEQEHYQQTEAAITAARARLKETP